MTPEVKAKIESAAKEYRTAQLKSDPNNFGKPSKIPVDDFDVAHSKGSHFAFPLGREQGIREVVEWLNLNASNRQTGAQYAIDIELRFLGEKK